MASPEVSGASGDNAEYQRLVRAMSEIQGAVDAYAAYRDTERQLADAREMLRESDGAPPPPQPPRCECVVGVWGVCGGVVGGGRM